MRINIERLRLVLDELKQINSASLDELEFVATEYGEPIAVDKKIVDEWKFTGLSNVSFIEMHLPGASIDG